MNAQIVPIVPTSDKNGSTYYRPHPVSNRCSSFVTSNILSILLFAQVTDFYIKANRIQRYENALELNDHIQFISSGTRLSELLEISIIGF